MYGKPFIAGIALALAAVSPSAAAADSPAHQLKQLRLATTAFNSLDVAKAAGWDQDITGCLSRSEEHTSELQSLMRISYAVFCLKKKNITPIHTSSSRLISMLTQHYTKNKHTTML